MEELVTDYRQYLQKLIDDEQRRLRIGTREMLALLQSHVSLPDFYRIPAQAAAADICEQSAGAFRAGELSDALQEAMKAVYGAWIRKQFRNV